MKVLRIAAEGLPLFKETFDITLYSQQRVSEDDKEKLYKLKDNYYLHPACAFIGINASGKTSILKLLSLALGIVNNEPINHIETKSILGDCQNAVISTFFFDKRGYVCKLETAIASKKNSTGNIIYSIVSERLWEKSIQSVKSKKYLTDFTGLAPISIRDNNEEYLSDDVSFIIAHNKKYNEQINVMSLLSYTNVNILPYIDEIPLEIIAFLDPTIDKLYFERTADKTIIHLRFISSTDEIVLNSANELELYLSSGTIKGIVSFVVAKNVLQTGGYLLIDEIENHFNKEIVTTLIRFFMDSQINKNGGTLLFTTHYSELLDIFDRNDQTFIVRNLNGITADNLSALLKRNDMKKSDVYQSGLVGGTAPSYEAYMRLRKSFLT